jgi:ABC-type uncharacterized transport system permease subunit
MACSAPQVETVAQVIQTRIIIATIIVFGTVAIVAGTLTQWFARSDHVQAILN